jgi:toxin YoeB
MYKIEFTKNAQKDIKYLKVSGDYPSLKREAIFLEEICQHPFTGKGNPEILKYNFSGFYSRRINSKDRLIYFVNEEKLVVTILSACSHYKKT